MSYENDSYGNYPSPRTYEERLKAWPEGRKKGIFKNFNVPKEFALDFLEFEMEVEFEKIYKDKSN